MEGLNMDSDNSEIRLPEVLLRPDVREFFIGLVNRANQRGLVFAEPDDLLVMRLLEDAGLLTIESNIRMNLIGQVKSGPLFCTITDAGKFAASWMMGH
jgi:hypothetical protein